MQNKIKDLRIEKQLTQKQVAELVGISLRSYVSYEKDNTKIGTLKYNYIIETLKKYNFIDEEHGLLSLDLIKSKCKNIFSQFDVKYSYLFGSYAKGKALENSDVDLLVATSLKGIKFFDLVENLRETLHKKVDVINLEQLKSNLDLINEILRDGIKIYVQP